MVAPEQQTEILLAFDLAPVGLIVSHDRMIKVCNMAMAAIFGFASEELIGRSIEQLYPSRAEFTEIGARALMEMHRTGQYSDERIMRRKTGELFWCHVSGRALRREDPYATAVWMFEDISAKRPVYQLTERERDVARLLVEGMTSKQIAATLGISARTVEAYRSRLMKKFALQTPGQLIARLIGYPT